MLNYNYDVAQDARDRAWENWQYYHNPYDPYNNYVLPPSSMEYCPPRAAYGDNSIYGRDDRARVGYTDSDINRHGAPSGYHHAHGAHVGGSQYGDAMQYYGRAEQNYHNNAIGGSLHSTVAARHRGRYGLDTTNTNPVTSMFAHEDCDDLHTCDDCEHHNDFCLKPADGNVADMFKAVKKNVGSAIQTVRVSFNPTNVNHHVAAWKEYLANPNYTHDVERAQQSPSRTGFVVNVLYWHGDRVFSGIVHREDVGFKNWANPKQPKKICLYLETRIGEGKDVGKNKLLEQTVVRDSGTPEKQLSKNVLFECLPIDMTDEDKTTFGKLNHRRQMEEWIKMHPGRIHTYRTFANFQKEGGNRLGASNKNAATSMCVHEDCGNVHTCDDCDDHDDFDLKPSNGNVTDMLNAAKKNIGKAITTIKTSFNCTNVDHHAGAWKEYLANPNYTHDVELAQKPPMWKYFNVLYWHGDRIFSGVVQSEDTVLKNWANPKQDKEIMLLLSTRKANGKEMGKREYFAKLVGRGSGTPEKQLSKNVLFERIPVDITDEDRTKLFDQNLPIELRREAWRKMHPGRLAFDFKTFGNFQKEEMARWRAENLSY